MNPLEKLAAKKFLIRELSKLAMLPKTLPPVNSPKAKKWTQRAQTNAQRMGHGGRWDFNPRQSMPVTQTTMAAAPKPLKNMSVASR